MTNYKERFTSAFVETDEDGARIYEPGNVQAILDFIQAEIEAQKKLVYKSIGGNLKYILTQEESNKTKVEDSLEYAETLLGDDNSGVV